MLIKAEYAIVYTKYNYNSFMLKLAISNKAIQVTGRRRTIYIVNKNKNIKIWY